MPRSFLSSLLFHSALLFGFLLTAHTNELDETGLKTDSEVYPLATINLGHLLSDHPWIRLSEESRLRQALEEIGFVVLTNHGMPRGILDTMWNVTREFFDTELTNKQSVPMTEEYMYGYTASEILSRSETEDGYGMGSDQKETFQAWIGSEHTDRLNNVRWPPKPKGMKEAWVNYYRLSVRKIQEAEKIHAAVLRSVARILEVDERFFEGRFTDHMTALRALNYPDQSDEPPPVGSLRCSPHSDYGTFTLLAQDTIGGLQVETKEGKWMNVVSDRYDFIMNIGDLMRRWTNDRFRSTRHRVVNAKAVTDQRENRRQSIAFFGNPNGDALIETFPSCLDESGQSKYESISFIQFLEAKHHATQTSYEYNTKKDL